jgi:hypothetical protein
MPELIRRTLDLSYTPTWGEILADLSGMVTAALLFPAVVDLVAVAIGWVQP